MSSSPKGPLKTPNLTVKTTRRAVYIYGSWWLSRFFHRTRSNSTQNAWSRCTILLSFECAWLLILKIAKRNAMWSKLATKKWLFLTHMNLKNGGGTRTKTMSQKWNSSRRQNVHRLSSNYKTGTTWRLIKKEYINLAVSNRRLKTSRPIKTNFKGLLACWMAIKSIKSLLRPLSFQSLQIRSHRAK